MPRSLHGILISNEWTKKVASDLFRLAVIDITAYFVWPAFGINAYMECYSGFDPIWQLAHGASMWADAFRHIGGITPQYLADNRKLEIPWLTQEEAQHVFMYIGLCGIEKNGLQPSIDVIKEMRCYEDFDARESNVKIDFYRKWYHTRWRYKTVSLDQLIDENGSSSRNDAMDFIIGDRVQDTAAEFDETVCSKLDAERFYASLKPKDKQILELRVEGYTYQEIADKLGYKTHSAVLKRIRKIADEYLVYADDQEGLRAFLQGDY